MTVSLLTGDALTILRTLESESVQTCVTSPPYFGLRRYLPDDHVDKDAEIGREPTLAAYIASLVDVFREVRRVLHDSGTVWLNLGSSYGPNKCDLMVPSRVALALIDDAWILRSEIVWAKPNPMPESCRDRPTSAHEKIFLLTKCKTYYYDAGAIREPLAASSVSRLAQDVEAQAGSHRANGGAKTNGTMGAVVRGTSTLTGGPRSNPDRRPSRGVEWCTDKQRGHSRRHAGFNDRWDELSKSDQQANGANARNVWTIPTQGYKAAHFATFSPEIPRRCILAGSREGDTVLDPFSGAGTTALVADQLGRHAIGIDINPDYVALAEARIRGASPLFAEVLT